MSEVAVLDWKKISRRASISPVPARRGSSTSRAFEMTVRAKAGKRPPAELEAAMGELVGQWSKTGAFVSGAGLRPTSKGARVRMGAGKITVSDGPFAESKEVIGGFLILKADNKPAAVEMTRRFVEVHERILGDDFQVECEVREIES
jgi:hypothetical protein